jgi:hypothetical protein
MGYGTRIVTEAEADGSFLNKRACRLGSTNTVNIRYDSSKCHELPSESTLLSFTLGFSCRSVSVFYPSPCVVVDGQHASPVRGSHLRL